MRFPFYTSATLFTFDKDTYMGKADTVRGVDVERLSLRVCGTTSSGISDCSSAEILWKLKLTDHVQHPSIPSDPRWPKHQIHLGPYRLP